MTPGAAAKTGNTYNISLEIQLPMVNVYVMIMRTCHDQNQGFPLEMLMTRVVNLKN